MNKIRTRLIMLLALLCTLPVMGQKGTQVRIRTSKDCPFMIVGVRYSGYALGDYQHGSMQVGKDGIGHTFNYEEPVRFSFDGTTMDSNDSKGSIYIGELPLLPGENLQITVLDQLRYEIGGSTFYQEYGKARKAIFEQGTDVFKYVSAHRREKGCALYVLTYSDIPRKMCDSLYNYFDPSVRKALPLEQVDHELDHYDRGNLWNSWRATLRGKTVKSEICQLDRRLEGAAILDTLKARYVGRPTLIYVGPDLGFGRLDARLLNEAKDISQVFLSVPREFSTYMERNWKDETKELPGYHYLIMKYQAESLRQAYMPGSELFYLLLDAQGRLVAKGAPESRQEFQAQLGRVLREAGLSTTLKPYKAEYLDMEIPEGKAALTGSQKSIVQRARDRMSYNELIPGENRRTYSYNQVGSRSASQLALSPRLYAYVRNLVKEDRERQIERDKRHDEAQKEVEKRRDPNYDAAAATAGKTMPVGQAVDLGLSVLWADMNVGAKKPGEPGKYYTWGDIETMPAGPHTWDNYKWSKGSKTTLTKYCTSSLYGAVDGRLTLEAKDDVASVRWGGDWRTPTWDELSELRMRCTWTLDEQDGMKGYKVTGPNGNSIFIPFSGCMNHNGLYGVNEHGYIWTSTIDAQSPSDAYYLGAHPFRVDVGFMDRTAGRPVRPVMAKAGTTTPSTPTCLENEAVDLGLSVKWANMNLGASKIDDYGSYYAWGDVQPSAQPIAVWGTYKWCEDSQYKLLKYNGKSQYGKVDDKLTLEAEDDAARQQLGKDWRMPTREEMQELCEKCKWTWGRMGKLEGYYVTGPNGNCIFLPATGCKNHEGLYAVGSKGYYWTSTRSGEIPCQAYFVCCDENSFDTWVNDRCVARAIRPVCP